MKIIKPIFIKAEDKFINIALIRSYRHIETYLVNSEVEADWKTRLEITYLDGAVENIVILADDYDKYFKGEVNG